MIFYAYWKSLTMIDNPLLAPSNVYVMILLHLVSLPSGTDQYFCVVNHNI